MFCFLCFTVLVSFTGFYTSDEPVGSEALNPLDASDKR